jgi:molybdenum cofactor cytidylyltransferase
MKKIIPIILAAGSSSRLGQPKQLLVYQGITLLERVFEIAKKVTKNTKIVVGNYSEEIIQLIDDKQVILHNPAAHEGMGTSIRVGVEAVKNEADAVLILLTDQPFVTFELLEKMIALYEESQAPIIACDYGEQLGVPILFDRQFFPELLQLSGDKGARAFLKNYPDQIKTVSFPEGKFDIDTPEDLVILRRD